MLGFSQSKKNESPIFTVKAAPNEQAPDSIIVRFFKGTISESLQFAEVITPKKSQDGSFTFSFSKEQPLSPFWIQFCYGGRVQKSLIFYAQPTDRIKIEVKKSSDTIRAASIGSLTFSGKGVAKYKLRELFNEMRYKNQKIIMNLNNKVQLENIKQPSYFQTLKFREYLNNMFETIKSNEYDARDTLAKYQNQIGEDISKFYKYELAHNLQFVSIIRLLFDNATSAEAKQMLADFYFAKINSLRPDLSNNDLFKYGVTSRWMMSNYIAFDLYFKSKDRYPFSVQYDEIKKVKDKDTRNILLTRLLVDGTSLFINDVQSRDSCLYDALKIIYDPELRAALESRLLFKKGSKIDNFKFLDITGNRVGLNDLAGKVFILDFYYFGCAPCVDFGKRFKTEIYPEFANNPNFKVLSVDGADSFENWLQAIKSGIYTLPNSINLITGVKFEHPIFKKYNVKGFPWVLLIDKEGNVIDFDVSMKSSPEIRTLIRIALSGVRNSK
jgi:thiol-disulfide isomerase/thioredoxin